MCVCIIPVQAVNAFCLMLLTIPSIGLMTLQLKQVGHSYHLDSFCEYIVRVDNSLSDANPMLSLSRRATGAWCTWGSAVSPSSAWRSLPGSTTASSAPTGPGSGSPTSTGCGTSSSSSPHTAPSCSSPTVMSSTTCHTRLQYSSKYSTASL